MSNPISSLTRAEIDEVRKRLPDCEKGVEYMLSRPPFGQTPHANLFEDRDLRMQIVKVTVCLLLMLGERYNMDMEEYKKELIVSAWNSPRENPGEEPTMGTMMIEFRHELKELLG